MVKLCFIAGDGRILLQVDFGTLEIRVAALLSGDPKMIAVLQSGVDFHLATAMAIGEVVWGMTPEEIKVEFEAGDKTKRTISKTINFATLYGQSAFAMAAQISADKGFQKQNPGASFSVEQAEAAQEAILGEYIVLREWIKDQVNRVLKYGDAWTQWDGRPARRRPLYAAGYDDWKRSGTAKRSSYNTPVQGSGSDICLMSVIWTERICRELWGDRCFPVLTVHDSILFDMEADRELMQEVVGVVDEIMTGWPFGEVPLTVDYECGPSWGSLEKMKVDEYGNVRHFGYLEDLDE